MSIDKVTTFFKFTTEHIPFANIISESRQLSCKRSVAYKSPLYTNNT
jgi:hypothetical protein